MKKTGVLRAVALLAALLMSVGWMPVYAEETFVPVELQAWKGDSLQQSAAQTGTLNAAGNRIFTTYEELIGVYQQQGVPQNVMVHSMYMPVKYRMEDSLSLTVRLYAGEEVTGTVCWADLIYDAVGSGDTYDFKLEIDAETYQAAPVVQDGVYGYPYREFTMEVNLDDPIYDMDEKSFQVRFYNFGVTDITLYRMEVYNETAGEVIFIANPYALYKAEHITPVEKVTIPAGNNSGIVTYSGAECFPQRPQANTEPYCKFNADGMNNKALLLDTGRTLTAGTYEFVVDFATCYTLVKGERAIFELIRREGENETVVWNHIYTHEEAAQRLGSVDYVDTEGMYDRYVIPVEVPAGQTPAQYALRIYATNYSDLYVRGVTLNELVPASLAAVRAVENQISALPAADVLTLDDAPAVEAARSALENLTAQQREQVSAQAVQKLEEAQTAMAALRQAYETKRADAAKRVSDAIDAIGPLDETNYMTKKEAIDAAQSALEEYDALYPDEQAASLITNRQALSDAQAAWEKLSTAIAYGDIDLNGSIDASDALMALQHSVSILTLDEAQYRRANVDGNETVDASDALLILQHSVQLIDRFPVEK